MGPNKNEYINPYDLAYRYAVNTNKCMFLTGKAGTGKTTLLRKLRKECPKQMAVVAPTGIAAINAEGVTIHSFFQLPPQLFLPTAEAQSWLIREIQMRAAKQHLLQVLELLIIDEVSMVRSDLLDAMDAVLRHFRHRKHEPFGGVQVIFIGDLYQLSPVAKEEEWRQMQDFYDGPYFFQAHVLQELHPVYIELDHVYRQEDQRFVEILNQVRENHLSREGRDILNSRYIPHWKPKDDLNNHIILSTHNRKVDQINEDELNKLPDKEYTYTSMVEGTFPDSMYPMDEVLRLKKGARVMFIRNDTGPEKAYYNGKIGVVKELDNNSIVVESTNEQGHTELIKVHKEIWPNIRYSAPKTGEEEINVETIGTFAHYPLRLAWAVTIHKAQGLTFDHVVIDAADSFAAGQVYVALSRCRTLDGIILLSPIPDKALTNAKEVLLFTAKQPDLQLVASHFYTSSQQFLMSWLMQIFSFSQACESASQINKLIAGRSSYNTLVATEYVRTISNKLEPWNKTAISFQRQLHQIMEQDNQDRTYLTERLQAAAGYFIPRIEELTQLLNTSPVYTDDKTDARDYEEQMKMLYQHICLKRCLMQAAATQPGVNYLFETRSKFATPLFKIHAYGGAQTANNNVSHNPKILETLKILRKKVAIANGWSDRLYRVAGTKTLVAISNALPRTSKELMKIPGFGKKSMELWGIEILKIVNNMRENP